MFHSNDDCLFIFHQQATETLALGYINLDVYIWRLYQFVYWYTSEPSFIIIVSIEAQVSMNNSQLVVPVTLLSALTINDSDHTQLQGSYHMTTARQSV